MKKFTNNPILEQHRETLNAIGIGEMLPPLEDSLEDLSIELHKEKCLRIKAETYAVEISTTLGEKIRDLEYQLTKTKKISDLELKLYRAKKNWWKKFKLPKLVWRDEYDES